MHQVVERYHVDDNVSIQPMSFSMMTQMNSLHHAQIPHMVYEGPSGQAFCREPGGQVQVCVCFAAHAMCACGTSGRFLPSLCIVLVSLFMQKCTGAVEPAPPQDFEYIHPFLHIISNRMDIIW